MTFLCLRVFIESTGHIVPLATWISTDFGLYYLLCIEYSCVIIIHLPISQLNISPEVQLNKVVQKKEHIHLRASSIPTVHI